jgi:hypothetical protein
MYWEWRDEFITKLGLLVAGGALAADETNITPGAGARASTNAEQGYAVYHLDDSLHGTAPVYIRFGFGTASNASCPRIRVTVGTSTNGSGVLGGTALTASLVCNYEGAGVQSSDTARQSYMSGTDGFFGFSWKIGYSTTPEAFFGVTRTCDADGVMDARGALCMYFGSGNTTKGMQALRFAATAAAYTASTSSVDLSFFPQKENGLIGSDIRLGVGWSIIPEPTPITGFCTTRLTDFAPGATFTAALVGSTPRTYIALTSSAVTPVASTSQNGGANYLGMLWE